MKVDGAFVRMKTLTRAALRIWQFVARYSTKMALCQGVKGDLAMAKNSRRVIADAAPATKDSKQQEHIAFHDKRKVIPPEATFLPSKPRVQVVALADWESAPTFLLEENYGKRQPVASTDALFNKCNPFLSDNRSIKRLRLRSEDNLSESPTMSTDCSSIPESYVEEEDTGVDNVVEVTEEEIKGDCKSSVVAPQQEGLAADSHSGKRPSRWICVGHGRYVKDDSEHVPVVTKVARPVEVPQSVRWTCVGYGRYEKHTL